MLGVDPLVLLDHHAAILVGDVEARDFTAQALGHELQLRAFRLQREVVEHEEVRQDLFRGQSDRLQQDRHRHLAAAVDAEVQDVLRIEFEVQPRTAVGDDACREQQLARAVGLALVVLEEHARRAVQLRDDDTLGAVDDERTRGSHERNLAHVDFLLLHFLDLARVLAIVDDQANLGAQGRMERQATLLAFLDVERRIGEVIRDELHTGEPVMRGDRENCVESGLEAFGLATCGRRIRLQELGVGFNLGGKQEWNLMYRRALRKAFANALLFGEAVRHGISESSQGWLDLAGPEVFSDWEGIWRLAATNLWLTVSARCGRCGRRFSATPVLARGTPDQTCLLQSVQKTNISSNHLVCH
ncbi:conserved protein of unknown function [Cupriavidus taiwanensis]|uniref:Uncharacterized protein n=1 Tax=Cupriavidus taiwanensis TaxID=164546 RepID=A0A375I9E9_9BURK|nr:conserved protein of unknown function [Cupriavidus taiwanensis]